MKKPKKITKKYLTTLTPFDISILQNVCVVDYLYTTQILLYWWLVTYKPSYKGKWETRTGTHSIEYVLTIRMLNKFYRFVTQELVMFPEVLKVKNTYILGDKIQESNVIYNRVNSSFIDQIIQNIEVMRRKSSTANLILNIDFNV